MPPMESNPELTNKRKDDTIESGDDPTNGGFLSGRKIKQPEKAVQNGEFDMQKDGVGSYAAPGVHMSKKELEAVSSAILTDYPNLKSGAQLPYEYGNFFYVADVMKQPGDYYFTAKIALTVKNQSKIAKYREVLKDD